ncbi:MAG: hypothetical protein WAL63_04840 [Solirubrobacteraceae bacterium]
MAKPKCFCGCGTDVGRFPLFIRSANNLGQDVTERLAYTRSILGEQMKHPDFALWDADGDAHINDLRNAIHHHMPISQDDLQRGMATGREGEKGITTLGGPSISSWLELPREMLESDAYVARVNEIRALLPAYSTLSMGGRPTDEPWDVIERLVVDWPAVKEAWATVQRITSVQPDVSRCHMDIVRRYLYATTNPYGLSFEKGMWDDADAADRHPLCDMTRL